MASSTAQWLIGPIGLFLIVALIALVVWVSQGGNLGETVRRIGEPGLGRDGHDTRQSAASRASEEGTGPDHRGTGVPNGTDPRSPTPARDPQDGSPSANTSDPVARVDATDAPPANPDDASDAPTRMGVPPEDTTAWVPGEAVATPDAGVGPGIPLAGSPGRQPVALGDLPVPAPDAVDRARAAAAAEALERAEAARAAKQARLEERRARRAAARVVRRDRNRWGWLVAAVSLIAAGVLFLTDQVGATDLGLLRIGIVALAILGVGVLVGTWFGSARWLIVPALALAAATGVGTWVSTSLDQASEAQPVTFAPGSLGVDQTESWSWRTGDVTVDLRETGRLAGGSVQLEVDRGALTVLIPKGTWTTVYTELWAGQNELDPYGFMIGDVQVANTTWTELNAPRDVELSAELPLSLNLHVRFGRINVIEES